MATTIPPHHRARRLGRRMRANLPAAELYEDAIRHGEGLVAADGPLVVRTGKHTGRSPQDKFIVDEPTSRDKIWWGPVNRPISRGPLRPPPEPAGGLLRRARPVRPGPASSARTPSTSAALRVYHRDGLGQHLRAQPVPPADRPWSGAASSRTSRSSACPSFKADPATEGTRTETAILLHLERMEIIIVGTEYAGEIKKSAFTVMNYLMPDEGVLPMHCVGQRRPGRRQRRLLRPVGHGQDDPVGRSRAEPHRRRRARLGRRRPVQLRGRLLREDDPPLADVRARHLPDHPAVRDGPRERRPRSADPRSSTSTPSASPRTPGAPTRSSSSATPIPTGIAGQPRTVIFLTADAFGVLPPIARLTRDQAAYHFISGYTAKLAGTEVGVKEPKRHVLGLLRGAVHAAPPGRVRGDADRAAGHATTCPVWLVNTGWTGGPYGTGERMNIDHTRAMVRAALDGRLDDVPTRIDPIFRVEVPLEVPGRAGRVPRPARDLGGPRRLRPRRLGDARGDVRRELRGPTPTASARRSAMRGRGSTPEDVAVGRRPRHERIGRRLDERDVADRPARQRGVRAPVAEDQQERADHERSRG